MPAELVREVLDLAVDLPAPFTFDTRVYYRIIARRNAFLRQTQLTCRAWVDVARHLLAQRIICRWSNSLRLRRAFTDSMTLRASVRSLTLGSIGGGIGRAVNEILGLCDGLQILVIGMPL